MGRARIDAVLDQLGHRLAGIRLAASEPADELERVRRLEREVGGGSGGPRHGRRQPIIPVWGRGRTDSTRRRILSCLALRIVDIPLAWVRCQLVVGDVPTLVDAGMRSDAPRILDAIRLAGLAPGDLRRIVLTHGDADHWGGAAALQEATGAEVLAHRDERPYLEGTNPAGFGLFKRAVVATSRRWRRPTITRWLVGGESIDGIDVVHAPGHTPGSLCLYAGDALLAGDTLSTGPRFREVPRLMSADVPRSREAIRNLAARPIARAFSGHGPPAERAGALLCALADRLFPSPAPR